MQTRRHFRSPTYSLNTTFSKNKVFFFLGWFLIQIATLPNWDTAHRYTRTVQGLEVKHTHTNYINTHFPGAWPPFSCNKKQQFEQGDLIWLNSTNVEQPEMNKTYQLPTKAIKPTRSDEQVPFSVPQHREFLQF